MTTLPRIEGIAKHAWGGDYQVALDEAGTAYHKRFGRRPTHVALPPGADPATVNVYTLDLGHHAGPGMVIVGRAIGNNGQTRKPASPTSGRQLSLF
jgi:hypothetical protein